jgi:hypothetical protein
MTDRSMEGLFQPTRDLGPLAVVFLVAGGNPAIAGQKDD